MQYEQLQQFDFPTEVPDEGLIEVLSEQSICNRERVLSQGEMLGLDPDFVSDQGPFLIGPFFSPGPIPTSFGGKIEQFQRAIAIGDAIARRIGDRTDAVNAAVVILDMTEMPKGGAEQMDVFVVPKNDTENKRVKLTEKVKYGTPYALVQTQSEVLTKATADILGSMNIAMQRNPSLKRYRDEIRAMIVEDLTLATDCDDEEMRYLDFAERYNRQVTERTTGQKVPIVSVDTQYYSPFIRNGIRDISQFLNALDSAGFFSETGTLLKVVDPALKKTRMLDVVDGNGRLKFTDTEEEIDFAELKERYSQIAPAKELSYLMCFGQLVPVMYGCDNRSLEGYYKPYDMAKQQVQRLGLSPTMYRTQDRMPYDYNEQGTVFDYYLGLISS